MEYSGLRPNSKFSDKFIVFSRLSTFRSKVKNDSRAETGITNKAMDEMNAVMDMLREEIELTQRTIVNGFRGLERKVEKWNRRLDGIERRISSLEASPRRMTPKVGCAVVESEIDFTKLPQNYLKAWLSGKRVLLIEFALDLERELYEDNPSELMLDVEDRTSTEKTNFIQKNIFKYFTIPKKSEEGVWRMVKNTLNARARASRVRAVEERV
ncbi:unnamed protein product [Haemonchus placei]|uniref:LINE-1 type transposase domain-containing protein 1 n=1 Tax=Haemonchus placei TaxID=6290 RepID=A0A0N4WFZ8_HAEPC|nr:unnamed protein product [Haemonchus placei]